MISHLKRKWVVALGLLAIRSVAPQVPMYPMFPPPMHVAVPMPVPVPIIIREQQDMTTTTTTTERSHVAIPFPIAVPMPMPMQVPFAVPAFPAVSCQSKNRPPSCPACPPCLCLPSCTPSFFSYCSPCHQKCRCRSIEDTPKPIPPRLPPPPVMGPAYGVAVPMPPMFGPPPIFVVPFPPPQQHWPSRPISSSSSYDGNTDSTDDSSSRSSYECRSKRIKKIGHIRRRPVHRRYLHKSRQDSSIEVSNNKLIKPVLTYLNKNGDVKLKRRLSNDEAAELMYDNKPYQKINLVSGNDEGNMARVLITSKNERKIKAAKEHRRKQVVLTDASQHMLGEGKKELVFRPPTGKKISNLSVSFHISER